MCEAWIDSAMSFRIRRLKIRTWDVSYNKL